VIVLVKQAKDAARRSVLEEASSVAGFSGAFFHGSTNWLPEVVCLPATSDVDVMVVLDDPDPPRKPGKFIYDEVLLEVCYLSRDQLRSPELILGQYHLAGSFRTPSIILDPSCQLTQLQTAVLRDYAKRWWVYRRCIASFTDLERRRDQVRQALAVVWEVAEAIIAANPAIEE